MTEKRQVSPTQIIAGEPVVSIIIPTYNVEKYTGRCMDSIICQSYPNLEIIPVNDGSTDNGGRILDQYARRDNRIKVVHQDNQGLIAARKMGVMRASGDYLFFVDGDDWIEPQAIDILLSRARETGADVTVGLHRNVSDDGSIQLTSYLSRPWLHNLDQYVHQIMDARISGSICTKLFKRGILTPDMFDFPRKYAAGEDFVINCGTFRNIILAAGIGDAVYNYYMRSDSICHTFVPQISYYQELCQIASLNMGAELAGRYALYTQRHGLMLYLDIIFSELYVRNHTYVGTEPLSKVQLLACRKEIVAILPFKYRIKSWLVRYPGLMHSAAHLWQFVRHGKSWQRYAQVEHP